MGRAPTAPTFILEASGFFGDEKFGQYVYASLFMCTEAGAEAHSIGDNTPGENRLEAWRRSVQRFDSASAQANLNLKSRILQPPSGKVDHILFLVE